MVVQRIHLHHGVRRAAIGASEHSAGGLRRAGGIRPARTRSRGGFPLHSVFLPSRTCNSARHSAESRVARRMACRRALLVVGSLPEGGAQEEGGNSGGVDGPHAPLASLSRRPGSYL